jgi:rhamnosyltransferase
MNDRAPAMAEATATGVCAVIVTFHPDGAIGDRIESVANEVGCVVVVDNGSGPETVERLRTVASRLKIELILNDSNRGVAAALNQGVLNGRQRGFRWALLLDHDTMVRPGIVSVLMRARDAYPNPESIGVVGSNYVETANGRPLIDRSEASPWVDSLVVITAGSLLSIPIFDEIGPFREELFIDDVDTEYCLRLRAHGYRVIIATPVIMDHTIGSANEEHRFLWRTVRPLNYSARRWYYLVRNSVVVAREYRHVAPGWAGPHLRAHLKWALKALVFEDHRGAKLCEMLVGAWHGMNGRLGPRPSRTPSS